MAGQRMNYSNVQTNTRGSVRDTAAFYLTGTSTLNPSLVSGPGFTVTGLNTTTFTVYVPERFAAKNVPYINFAFQSATTLLSDGYLVGGYTVPTTGQSYFQIQVVNWTSAAAIVNPIGIMYVEIEGAVGF